MKYEPLDIWIIQTAAQWAKLKTAEVAEMSANEAAKMLEDIRPAVDFCEALERRLASARPVPPPAIVKTEILPNAVYLTAEAAIICCVEESTIQATVRTGKIRAVGRPFRILGSELIKFTLGK